MATSRSAPLARAAFLLAFFALELTGIAWGQGEPDHVFGFQMFNESSRLTIHLFRRVKGEPHPQPLPEGRWQAPDKSGQLRSYAWQDRVHYFPLEVLERSMHARYGLAAQLQHLQAALDDRVRHLADDASTTALVAKVDTLRNGVAGQQVLRAEKP